ncbi:MAG: hypothetical protein Kow0065_13610 [Methylomicrobium sp.]
MNTPTKAPRAQTQTPDFDYLDYFFIGIDLTHNNTRYIGIPATAHFRTKAEAEAALSAVTDPTARICGGSFYPADEADRRKIEAELFNCTDPARPFCWRVKKIGD